MRVKYFCRQQSIEEVSKTVTVTAATMKSSLECRMRHDAGNKRETKRSVKIFKQKRRRFDELKTLVESSKIASIYTPHPVSVFLLIFLSWSLDFLILMPPEAASPLDPFLLTPFPAFFLLKIFGWTLAMDLYSSNQTCLLNEQTVPKKFQTISLSHKVYKRYAFL